jgi:hypothetical protein
MTNADKMNHIRCINAEIYRADVRVGDDAWGNPLWHVFDYTDSIGPLTEYGTFYTSGYAYDEGEVMPCGHECGDCYC